MHRRLVFLKVDGPDVRGVAPSLNHLKIYSLLMNVDDHSDNEVDKFFWNCDYEANANKGQ